MFYTFLYVHIFIYSFTLVIFIQGAIGFELWSMSEDILFDNILITSEKSVADDYAAKTWKMKQAVRAENEV